MAPVRYFPFDLAVRQIIKNLIAAELRSSGRGNFLQIGEIEIADAEVANLALILQLMQGLEGLRQRYATGPVQQV